jgi:hypothetical protein
MPENAQRMNRKKKKTRELKDERNLCYILLEIMTLYMLPYYSTYPAPPLVATQQIRREKKKINVRTLGIKQPPPLQGKH